MRHSYRTYIPPKPHSYRTQIFDHLGFVAGMFEELDIMQESLIKRRSKTRKCVL